MKVLFLVSGRELNGALTYCHSLAERLTREGLSVSILCRAESWLLEQRIEGVQYEISEMERTPAELKRIAQWIRQEQFDLVHTHMSRAHFFGVLLKWFVRVPVIATAHNCNVQLHWRLNDFVIANSRSTLKYQRRFNLVRADRSDAVYCFTDIEKFAEVPASRIKDVRRRLRVDEHDTLLGVVGQVGHRKGQKILFDALPGLFAARPDLKLVLVGWFERSSPYVRNLRSQVLKNGWVNRIRWTGPRDDVADYMNALDICVVPSLKEPLGLVAIESLAAGVPVIASDTGGLSEIVRHEENGLLVPRKNPGHLAEAILRLADSPAWRRRLGARGKEQVFRRFAPATLTDQIKQVYQSVKEAA